MRCSLCGAQHLRIKGECFWEDNVMTDFQHFLNYDLSVKVRCRVWSIDYSYSVLFGITCTILYQSKPSNFVHHFTISYFLLLFFLQQLLEAVIREDLPQCILLLAHCSPEDLNTAYEDRESCTALHISCSLGNIVITQLLIWVRFKLRVYILPNVSHTLYISPY